MSKIFIDTETCGLHGFAVLIQYAIDDGDTILFSPWTEPVSETLSLVEMFCEHDVIGFNLSYDWFHLCKLHTTFTLLMDKKGIDAIPSEHIDLIAELEPLARDGQCLKPKSAFDIMLHARKGPYQSTMNRADIKIKRVPTLLARPLAEELNHRVKLKDVYFARKKIPSDQWQVFQNEREGVVDPDFRDVVLKFAPSTALKALAQDALDLKDDSILLFTDVEVDPKLRPEEVGWAPFAKARGGPGRWNGAWPDVIRFHISHWTYNRLARKYAYADVQRYTRPLYEFFGSPECGDDDSILACMVGAVRWRGFKVDIEGIKQLKIDAVKLSKSAPKDPSACQKWLRAVMDDVEQCVLTSTKKTILEEIATWEDHPAGDRAQQILAARKAKKKVELYDKLLIAGRFHASFKVIGTKSTRMSGADGLNPQGIDRTRVVRSQFPLAWDDMILCGGDFAGFEVCLADAEYNDPLLREDLMTKVPCTDCSGSGTRKGKECKDCKGTGKTGKKLHALFGESLFPDEDYDSIMESKGTGDDLYDKSKRSVFAILYGGNEETIKNRIGIAIEDATVGYNRFIERYKKVGEERRKVFDSFCSMKQAGGIGTAIEWNPPSDYIESQLGFKRYFTLENRICKALFDMAQKPPAGFKALKIKVVRRDREQTATGAMQSALYAAAFAIQAANMRAAANHVIQASGAQITKNLQCALWALQPPGVNIWHIQPMNIHDEIMTPMLPKLVPVAEKVVADFVVSMQPKVPLIAIDWGSNLQTWSEK